MKLLEANLTETLAWSSRPGEYCLIFIWASKLFCLKKHIGLDTEKLYAFWCGLTELVVFAVEVPGSNTGRAGYFLFAGVFAADWLSWCFLLWLTELVVFTLIGRAGVFCCDWQSSFYVIDRSGGFCFNWQSWCFFCDWHSSCTLLWLTELVCFAVIERARVFCFDWQSHQGN